jgi:hypothetical protein
MIVAIRCVLYTGSLKASRIWNYVCTSVDYTITIQGTKSTIFFNTVSENKEGFTKRHIKGAELARTLYKTLSYPSMKDFKWVIQINQMKDCPVTVQYIDEARNIWVKNIAALKSKTSGSKLIPVARDYVKVPMELKNFTRRCS